MKTLKNVPFAMLGAGLFVVPALWAFALPKAVLFAVAPVTGLVFLIAGLHIKYRSRYSPQEALWSLPLTLIFFGSLLVASTTALAWRAQRPDLQTLAVGIAWLLTIGGLASGYWSEHRHLAASPGQIPKPLEPLLDLPRHRVRPMPSPRQPTIGRIAFLAALALNAPLLLQMGGWQANDVVWLAMPLLGGAVTYLLATGFGPALARAIAVRDIEKRIGQPFCTSRLEELQTLRRTFWLSRWLARPDRA
ncbi:hypothetical protein CDL60_19735 [Roseateles noduli]|nr:hypothetical protein CDL60_19735 [Roseateles noduli]